MFLDLETRDFPERPQHRVCCSCKHSILDGHDATELNFAHDPEHETHRLNGPYHSVCARPLLSVARALDACRRLRSF